MSNIKFGGSQINVPAPLFYRQFVNVMIVAILPAAATFIQAWGLSTVTANHILLIITFIGAILKGLGMFLGNGQTYTPTNEAVMKANETKP